MPQPCWRNEEDYRYLDGADRSGIAWEFLRRNADYRAMTSARSAPRPGHRGTTEVLGEARSALRWGLLFRRIADPPDG